MSVRASILLAKSIEVGANKAGAFDSALGAIASLRLSRANKQTCTHNVGPFVATDKPKHRTTGKANIDCEQAFVNVTHSRTTAQHMFQHVIR